MVMVVLGLRGLTVGPLEKEAPSASSSSVAAATYKNKSIAGAILYDTNSMHPYKYKFVHPFRFDRSEIFPNDYIRRISFGSMQ
jgi:hypothetical protein